jgi:drug/metabolite transporter (DMT)-like permease
MTGAARERKYEWGGVLADDAFYRKRVKFAVVGMLLALLSGLGTSANGYFNNAVQAVVGENVDQSSIPVQIVCILLMLGVFEFFSGIIGISINTAKGVPLKEYRRIYHIKSTRIVLLNALISGPVGTASFMIGTIFCGPTYATSLNALAPLFAAIGARIFLKEKVNLRVFIGIVIVIVGVVITCTSPYKATDNFYIGLIFLIIAPLCFATESLITGHVLDAQDPIEVCSMYRCIGSSILDWTFSLIILAMIGKLGIFKIVLATFVSSPYIILFMLLGIIGVCCNLLGIYGAVSRCGAAKSMAIQNAAPIWSIPMGLFFAAVGVAPYHVTHMAILAAFIVVVGVVLIVAKPSELFNLRDFE